MKSFIMHVERLPDADARAIESLMGSELTGQVERASILEWLPGQVNLEATAAVSRHLGPERSADFFRHLLGINAGIAHHSRHTTFAYSINREWRRPRQ